MTCARLILSVFDDFYDELCTSPVRAQRAFERSDPHASIRLSRERLNLYSRYIDRSGPSIQRAYPELAEDASLWEHIDDLYRPLIAARYEADIAFAFCQSIRRNIFHAVWRPVQYSFPSSGIYRGLSSAMAHQRFPLQEGLHARLIISALHIPRFKAPYRDIHRDADAIEARMQDLHERGEINMDEMVSLDVVEGAFFRDLTAFLVCRIEHSDGSLSPFVLALMNSEDGIFVKAVLHKTADVHNLFSSTMANFHVTNQLYYQVCVFLKSLMPLRSIGLHYSTIGFNHVGKVAVLNEIKEQQRDSRQQITNSPGFDGTVAIGFTFDDCSYHLKVIRDKPTQSYKWGEFAGIEGVLEKYRIVHEINRTGSMLDNIIYFNLELDRSMFAEDFLQYLLDNASQSISVSETKVIARYLIVQQKITPLPVFFEQANFEESAAVVKNLGRCIKNNMAANIFNKDLDVRNYGVGRYGKVFLFDYDAVERLTDIELATNLDQEEGEEDIPDWYFSEKFVFLPEELESGLQLADRDIRRCFRETNADLLSLDFWQSAQRRLLDGEVIGLQSYPSERHIDVAPVPDALD